jgi:pantoate--beta-alanine ligase
MQIIDHIADLERRLRSLQSEGLRVALVPTMGALHDGHLSLIRIAREHAEIVVASVFINPTQFGPNEDFTRYPRDLAGDSKKLEPVGCDIIFAPDTKEMYPQGFETEVQVRKTSLGLCGDVRPGHFKGVTTVVLKLFSIARPDVAVFGEKDLQQLAVIRAMVRDLALDVRVIGAPLVREADGLAMSSRNAFLQADDRKRALAISRGLFLAKEAYERGERVGTALVAQVRAELSSESIEPEYLELRSFDGLQPLDRADQPAVLVLAARVGSTRLIDNLILRRS